MKSAAFLFPGLAGILLTVSSCGSKQPGEDAVAVVNGHEITETELNHELAKQGMPESADLAIRRAAVEAIINRRLLADMAIERELDRTPEHILDEKRTRELLLAESAMRLLAPSSGQPDAEAIEAMVDGNLAAGQRTIFLVDSLQFQRPSDRTLMQRLTAASTFAEIQSRLAEAGIEAVGGRLTWDSAQMSPELYSQVSGLPDREPFLIPMGEGMMAGVVVDKRRQTLTPEQTRALATSAVTQRTAMERVQNWLTNARLSAEVTYGKGFAPEGGESEGEAGNEPAAATADAAT